MQRRMGEIRSQMCDDTKPKMPRYGFWVHSDKVRNKTRKKETAKRGEEPKKPKPNFLRLNLTAIKVLTTDWAQLRLKSGWCFTTSDYNNQMRPGSSLALINGGSGTHFTNPVTVYLCDTWAANIKSKLWNMHKRVHRVSDINSSFGRLICQSFC